MVNGAPKRTITLKKLKNVQSYYNRIENSFLAETFRVKTLELF